MALRVARTAASPIGHGLIATRELVPGEQLLALGPHEVLSSHRARSQEVTLSKPPVPPPNSSAPFANGRGGIPRPHSAAFPPSTLIQFAFVTRDFPELDTPPFMLALLLLLSEARAAEAGEKIEPFSLTDESRAVHGEWTPTDLLRTLPGESELRELPAMARQDQLDILRGTDAHILATNLQMEVEETHRSSLRKVAAAPASPFNGSVPLLSRWR